MDFLVILPTALDRAHFLVGKRIHERLQLRDILDPVLTLHVTGKRGVHLIVPVDRLLHSSLQGSVNIAFEQRIPARTPDHLYDVPVRASE